MSKHTDEILQMLKALADESRLSLLRLLNGEELTVGQLAQHIGLGEPTVSHHLTRLRESGFVTLRTAGNQRYYRINESGLARFKGKAAHIEQTPPQLEVIVSDDSWIDALGWDREEQQVLREHTVDGRLVRLPTKQKKTLVILRWLSTLFEEGRMYREIEVNDIIKTIYAEDYVSLRRDLISFGYLRRERGGGKYWLAPADEEG